MKKVGGQRNDHFCRLLISRIETQAAEHTVIQADRKEGPIRAQARRVRQEQVERTAANGLRVGLAPKLYGPRFVRVAQPKFSGETELLIEMNIVGRCRRTFRLSGGERSDCQKRKDASLFRHCAHRATLKITDPGAQ